MKENLRDLPLFTGSNRKVEQEYDFSKILGVDDVNLVLTIKRELADALAEYAKRNDSNPNEVIESVLKQIGSKP